MLVNIIQQGKRFIFRRFSYILDLRFMVQAKVDWQKAQPGDVPLTYADVSKAEKLLGYKPRTKPEEGIKKFVEWYRANLLLI